MAHSDALLTIIESPLFSKLWPDYWTEDERGEFAAFIANHPETGDVIPGSGGCRKIRWSRSGSGKRGGVRVIYTARLKQDTIVLLVMYAKSTQENIPVHILRQIAEEMGHAAS
jgi:mRNA-degrading endonuclease RelE of RelBE toxin-antitoxin system